MSKKKGRDTLVYGHGINDADYFVDTTVTLEDGTKKRKACPFYRKWNAMLERCYSETSLKTRGRYRDCYVSDEWLIFSNFKAWMEQQDWKGKQLDKDLLVYQNKVYSPETCVFVSKQINTFLIKSDKTRGEYPLGVFYRKKPTAMINEHSKPYRAKVSCCNKKVDLGVYRTAFEAHRAWQLAKSKEALRLASLETDPRVVEGLKRVASKIQYDYDNGLETIDF